MGWAITKTNKAECFPTSTQTIHGDGELGIIPVKFRLLDDDRIVYYEGFISAKDLNGDEYLAFAPLDWAMEQAGAVHMQYLENGEWKTL